MLGVVLIIFEEVELKCTSDISDRGSERKITLTIKSDLGGGVIA